MLSLLSCPSWDPPALPIETSGRPRLARRASKVSLTLKDTFPSLKIERLRTTETPPTQDGGGPRIQPLNG